MVGRMTSHATRGADTASLVAGQVRAELARHNKTAGDLADALGVTQHTVGRRLSGKVPFTAAELVQTAAWLGVDTADLFPRKAAS